MKLYDHIEMAPSKGLNRKICDFYLTNDPDKSSSVLQSTMQRALRGHIATI